MRMTIMSTKLNRLVPLRMVIRVIAILSVVHPALSRSQEITLAQHNGLSNPLTEGFLRGMNGTPVVGSVTNDMGYDAWAIRFPYPSGLSYARYFSNEDLSESDWVLSVTAQFLTHANNVSGTFTAGIATGTDFFSLFFGAQQDGDQSVRVLGNGSFTPDYILEGAGSGYHNYELRYSAANRTVDLWVDGAQIYNDLEGQPSTSSPYLAWGGNNPFSNLETIEGRWNLIELSVVPEPSTAALLVLGAVLTGLLRTSRLHRTPGSRLS